MVAALVQRCASPPTTGNASTPSPAYPHECEEGEIELASGIDFAQRLFFSQPRSDLMNGTWIFDGMPHRVITMDRLRPPRVT